MASENRVTIGIFVASGRDHRGGVRVVVLGRDNVDESLETAVAATPTPAPEPTPTLEERLSSRLSGTTLATSDIVVRELASEISANPKLAAWLVNEDLVRRFVASVDNIASGISPQAHLDFLRPREGFEVDQRRNGVLVIETDSYGRYDLVAQVFASLDTEGTVALYGELKPLIDEAYAEIGPSNANFDDRLDRAFDLLTGGARAGGACTGRAADCHLRLG